MISRARLESAYLTARDALLAERNADGFWVGELSSSALAGAVACIALQLIDKDRHAETIRKGMDWLIATQNPDGGWGDTTKSFSNISTSMLIRAAFAVCDATHPAIEKLERYLNEKCGKTQAERAEAIRNRYGTDRTFSVPILMTSALAGLIPWHEVPRLPFEAAALPQSWYRFARMPVVSYALPALIAIGQCIHHHRPTWNPFTKFSRWLTAKRTQRVLQRIQPSSGGYLEATPLTAFVCMSLQSLPASKRTSAANDVLRAGERFLIDSMRPDGSWPIDTNLSIWVTTLSVNALASGDDLKSLPDKQKTIDWLLDQQLKEVHPYTGAAPGGWGWSHCPGSVPDCDDTPGAVIVLSHLNRAEHDRISEEIGIEGTQYNEWDVLDHARQWMIDLRNRDGGFPTFCKGWGKLPFDRSGCDLTAHVIRAMSDVYGWWFKGYNPNDSNGWHRLRLNHSPEEIGFRYLREQQKPDGSWLPLWFGNQNAESECNPVYGTAKVLSAYLYFSFRASCGYRYTNYHREDIYTQAPIQQSWKHTYTDTIEFRKGVEFLLSIQNDDGGWGGDRGCPSSIEETSLTLEVLLQMQNLYVATEIPSVREAEEANREQSPLNHEAKNWGYDLPINPIPTPPMNVGNQPVTFQPLLFLLDEYPNCSKALDDFVDRRREQAIEKGLQWLLTAVESGRFREPAPIGFYFAKLWYFEKLYPLIFTVAALGAARRYLRFDDLDHDARDVVP